MSCVKTVQAKPPNVLVLSASVRGKPQEQDSGFLVTKECLSACLDSERYVVYPLPLDDLVHTPWKDNCRLLVVPSTRQPTSVALNDDDSPMPGEGGGSGDGVMKELLTYIRSGGRLLSMNPATNAALGCRMPESFRQAPIVNVTTQTGLSSDNVTTTDWVAVRPCTSEEEGPTMRDDFPPPPVEKSSRVLARMKQVESEECAQTKDLVQDSILHVQYEEGHGQAVLSHVNLLGSTGPHGPGVDIPELVTLKRDAEKVTKLLRVVLEEIGMECSEGESSDPTLSYLLCSDQV